MEIRGETMNWIEFIGPSVMGAISGGIVSYFLAKYKYQQLDLTRYIDSQFPIYRKLWGNIYSLKLSADILWDKANKKNLRSFSKQLEETEKKVNNNMIFIERKHVIELKNMFKEFWGFKIKKDSLLEMRKQQEKYNEIKDEEVEALINRNGNIKSSYDKLIKVLANSFRNQIKYPRL